MGRITRISSPLGNITEIVYDELGRILTTANALNIKTTFSRDERGFLTGLTLPGSTIAASYARNEIGQITTVTDPNGNDWLRSYDPSGRQISGTDPLGNADSTSYDNRNLPDVVTFPGGLGTITLGFDVGGRLTSKAYSDGTSLSYSYDDNDRLTSADGIILAYDDNNRIINSNGVIINRDPTGHITGMTLATDKTISYNYDANDRLTRVTDWVGGMSDFSYDDAGRLISMTRPNGVITTYTYDKDSRVTGIDESTLSDITLARDGIGQVIAATRNVPQEATADSLAGKVLTYNAASEITGFNYDALGRLSGDDSRTYTWDLASHLTKIVEESDTTNFSYDALDHRLSHTSGVEILNYVWNYALDLISVSIERKGASDSRYFIHTPDGFLLYSIDANDNAREFFHFDEMGNTLFVTNDGGVVIGSYAYTPYGQILASTGDPDNLFTWQGRFGVMQEGTGGLYYMRARYYDSVTGRFISRDPVSTISPRSINPYQYALGNPLQFIDPNGLRSFLREAEDQRHARNKQLEAVRREIVARGEIPIAYLRVMDADRALAFAQRDYIAALDAVDRGEDKTRRGLDHRNTMLAEAWFETFKALESLPKPDEQVIQSENAAVLFKNFRNNSIVSATKERIQRMRDLNERKVTPEDVQRRDNNFGRRVGVRIPVDTINPLTGKPDPIPILNFNLPLSKREAPRAKP